MRNLDDVECTPRERVLSNELEIECGHARMMETPTVKLEDHTKISPMRLWGEQHFPGRTQACAVGWSKPEAGRRCNPSLNVTSRPVG